MKNLPRLRQIVFVLFASFVGSAGAVEITSDIDAMINTLSSDSHDEQMQTCRDLEVSGLSDKRLFDQVQKNLLAIYKTNTRDEAEYAAWLTKCLAFSGVEDYRKTIEEVAQNGIHRGVKRHGLESQTTLSEHNQWNPEIVAQADNPALSIAANRIVKAVNTNDIRLQLAAARWTIERNIADEAALDALQDAATPRLKKIMPKEDMMAVAYMLKAIAKSGNARYRPTLELAASSASEPKLRNYAGSYLKDYY